MQELTLSQAIPLLEERFRIDVLDELPQKLIEIINISVPTYHTQDDTYFATRTIKKHSSNIDDWLEIAIRYKASGVEIILPQVHAEDLKCDVLMGGTLCNPMLSMGDRIVIGFMAVEKAIMAIARTILERESGGNLTT